MVRHGQDDWSVHVCRDWEAVLDIWSGRTNAQCTAVLHIGFDRPPTLDFEPVAKAFPGRMLYSAAARYGLPPGFDASDQSVGEVSNLPIHLALKGWGYMIDQAEAEFERKPPRTTAEETEGWVKEFLAAHLELESAFLAVGIKDEATYLDREATLPSDARFHAGLYRCRYLLADVRDDPCALATAAPPWFRSRALDTIGFTVRAANVFAMNGFLVVSDLASTTLNKLLELPNFGRTSANDAVAALQKALNEGPNDPTFQKQRSGSETLLVEVYRAMALLGERESNILARRMGLGCPPETLQSIGDTYSITRERIRQLESRIVKRLTRECYWDDLLSAKLEDLLRGRTFPLPLLGIEALDTWFAGVAASSDALRYILANFCDDRVGLVTIDGIEYFGFLTQDRWEAALREAKKVLSLGANDRWTEQHCRAVVSPIINERASEFRGLLWDHAIKQCHFADDTNGNRILASYGRGAEQVVEAILLEAEQPLHYTEIVERSEKRTLRQMDVRRIHNAAANVGILLERGTFGLEKHLGLSADTISNIQEEVIRIVTEGPAGRQWHASELQSSLVDSGVVNESIDKYRVDFVLRGVSSLRRLGRMAWIENTESANEVARIDIRQNTISILEAAGKPLSSQEIRQRMVALRGVNGTFQIMPGDPIIRIDHGKWGLNDRDVVIKRPQQAALIADLVDRLRNLGRGIHLSELGPSAILEQLGSPIAAIGIATTDARIRFSFSQYLYLSDWGEPRRESVLDAVRNIMIGGSDSLAFEAIVQLVTDRLERTPARSAVSASLQSVGAVFDPSSDSWSLSGDQIEFVDSDEPIEGEEPAEIGDLDRFDG